MNILFLSRWFPWPQNNGSKIRIYNLLRGLAIRHQITLFAFSDEPVNNLQIEALSPYCSEIQVFHWRLFNPNSLESIFGFLNPYPRSIQNTYSPEMAQQIRESVRGRQFDRIVASQIETAAYAKLFKGIPSIFEEVEVGVPYDKFHNAKNTWTRIRSGLTWIKHKHYMKRILKNFQACTVVSDREHELMKEIVPGFGNVQVIPNCVSIDDSDRVSEAFLPHSLIFTGSFKYSPNYQAMCWFLNEVYPLVQTKIPDVSLQITGDHAGMQLPNLENVFLTGFVEDIRAIIAKSAVSIAPLLEGGGTRLKILEAMALRTPVVSTTKGAEGLDVFNNKHLLIADEPSAFADAVVRLMKDTDLRQRLTENAYQLIENEYNWDVVLPKYVELVESLSK